uniref:Uncharacterized protein n=1 Tax=Knipowitschia caucasica TaxID=637954 RepID=A0AAV2IZK8_KNICA
MARAVAPPLVISGVARWSLAGAISVRDERVFRSSDWKQLLTPLRGSPRNKPSPELQPLPGKRVFTNDARLTLEPDRTSGIAPAPAMMEVISAEEEEEEEEVTKATETPETMKASDRGGFEPGRSVTSVSGCVAAALEPNVSHKEIKDGSLQRNTPELFWWNAAELTN